MSYEEALLAFETHDYQTAAALLELAARDVGYTSELINNAYTLALYRIGDNSRLADVAFRVGKARLHCDPASALDYFQRAIYAGLDAKRVRQIGELFEASAAPVIPRPPEAELNRVAHVVGSLLPGHVQTQYLTLLVSSLRKQGIESTIFTTESAASWFFNPSAVPQSRMMNVDAEVRVASVEGDFMQRAALIGEALRESGIPVAIFHSDLSEQITARVASMRAVPLQVNVNHGSEMDADLFDGRIHLFENARRRTRFSGPAEWIPLVSDIESRLQTSQSVTRKEMGLECASSVSATFGNLSKVSGGAYLHALSEVMNRFPKHFHLFAGAGNVKAIRSHLHFEGVLPRVRFLGDVGDIAPLLEMVDVYLAPFPQSEIQPILEAMGAGKPVVVFRFPPDSPDNSGAELVGVRELTAAGEGEYITIVDRLLRNSELRAKYAQMMLERFHAQFRPDRLGERYKAFLESL